MRTSRTVWLLAFVTAALGCEHKSPEPVRVRGAVTVNGVPLRDGTIVFSADGPHGASGTLFFATIAADGTYDLAGDDGPGALPGLYRITIAPPANDPTLMQRLEKYRMAITSGLTYEVKPGGENVHPIAIEVP